MYFVAIDQVLLDAIDTVGPRITSTGQNWFIVLSKSLEGHEDWSLEEHMIALESISSQIREYSQAHPGAEKAWEALAKTYEFIAAQGLGNKPRADQLLRELASYLKIAMAEDSPN